MKPENNWKNKSIHALEKHDYGNPDNAPTHMVKRCLQLTKIPLINFTVEDLRLMIGQNFALDYLVPLAIEKLEIDMLAKGDYYAGDLLENVLNIDQSFWANNITLYMQLKQMILTNKNKIEFEGIALEKFNLSV